MKYIGVPADPFNKKSLNHLILMCEIKSNPHILISLPDEILHRWKEQSSSAVFITGEDDDDGGDGISLFLIAPFVSHLIRG